MKRFILNIALTLAITAMVNSQVPQAFKYQAIARYTDGNIIANEDLDVKISILEGETVIYSEIHHARTNHVGLIVLNIGMGETVTGDFETINWATDLYFLQVEIADPLEGVYQILGRSKLQSVPYALYAEKAGTVDNVDDADAAPGNELQDLSNSVSGTDVTINITSGNGTTFSIDDGDSDNMNELQVLSISNDTIYLSDGGNVKLPGNIGGDNDNDSTNEIQTISLINDTIYLSKNGGSIPISASFAGDFDSLKNIPEYLDTNCLDDFSGNYDDLNGKPDLSDTTNWDEAYSWGNHADEGYLTEEQDSSITNELQDLSNSKTGNEVTIRISDGDSTTFNINDDDADPQNEMQYLYTSGDSVFISSGNGVAFIVSTDDSVQDLSLDTNINFLGITGGEGVFLNKYNQSEWTYDSISGAPINVSYFTNDAGYLTGETDPVFNTHLTSDITATDTANWNEAYGWGDHSAEGYLTAYNETDPVFNAHLTSDITTADTSNWNTAYTWGNHADEGYLTSYSETDPIFNAHLASNITATDTANWNEAHNWGDHSAEGYLTAYNETDPVFDAHLSSDITATDTANWNEAHSWGDHSAEGYLTAYNETDPVFDAHLTSDITGTDTANWNDAYGWGNHADEGYLTAYNETDPIFASHLSYGIMASDTANWNDAYGWGDHSSAGYLTSEVDGSVNNELQTINFLNDTLYLSDGGNIYLGEYKESLSDTINFGNNILRTSKIISGYDSSLLDSGLVAYYPFNGDPNDESGNDNNGNVNGASLTTDRFGNASSAYSFDGTDDYIDIPITDFELDKGSIILWFQIDGVNYGEQKFIFNISNNTNEIITEFVMKIDQRTGMVTQRLMSVMFIDDPDPRPWQIDVHENDFNSVTNFNWNCMAVVQDGTEIIMYLNGNSIGTLSFTNDVASWWNDLFNATNPSTVATIGALRRNGTTIGSFDGKIDDIRIYNRVLTQYEVQALYEGEAYGELTFYDPIAGDVSLSELKNNPGDFSNGGEAGGAVRTLGNIDNYGLGFLTSNDTSLYIDENGNVGIGTTNPKAHLQIGPRMTIISKSGYTNMYNNNAYVDYVVDDYRYLVDGYATQYQQSSAGEHVFRIAPSGTANTILSWAEVLRIKSTGNVGIGTTDPQNKLDVEGGTVIGASYSGTNTAPTNGLLVEGNVGIGVISPEKRLHVNGDIMINALEKFIAKFDNSGDEFRGNFGFDGIQFGNNNWNYIVAGNTYGGRLMFVVNNTTDLVDYNRYSYHNGIEAMGITTSGGIVIGPSFMGNNPGTGNMIITGNVGIGTTSSSGKLHVQGGTTDDADSAFVVTSDGNVGIGTLNPAYKMELASNKEHTAIRLRCNGASKTSDWSVSALTVSGPESSFAIHDNRENAYRLYIDSLGYTGINNYNPQYQLDVSGDIRIRSGGQLIFGDGSSMSTAGTGSASSLSNAGDAIVTGDSDANSSGGVLFKTGSNTRMTILNNGNVGIGETNPLNKLTVTAGSVTNYSGDLNDIVALVGTGNVDTWINYWRESTTERQGILWSEDSRGDRGVFEMNASGNWAFHSGGNFGINTMTPSSLFHVQGGTTDDADSTFVVTDSGKVGIGTTLPKGKLEIDLGETDGIGGLIISEQGFERFGLYGYYSGGGATGNYTVLKSSDAADIMTWQNGGNVGISTTSPGGLLGLKNTNTYLDVDGSNNLTFTDAVTGTKTLAELAANNSLWTEDTYGMHSNYTSLGVGIDSKTGSNNNLYIYDPDNFNHAELLLDGHNAGFIYLKSRRASREYFITNCWSDVTSDANIHIGLSGGGLGMIFNPSNNLGLGTETPQNKLDIEGGAVIGASYSGTNTAPTNGLLVEGNVGIGIINPNAKLDVNGSVRLNDSNIYFRSGSDINHGLGFYQNPKLFDNIDVNGPVLFGCDRGGVGTTGLVGERMSILWDWNGKVYIDPGNRNNGSISNYGLLFGQNSTEGIASKRTSGGNQYGLDFYTNSTNRLSITTTGNIGINKSSPSGLLHVQGGTTGSADSAFVVTSDGDVGIGISTPNAKLDILGPYNTTPGENQTLRINHVYGFRTSTLYSDTIFFECLESNIWYPVFSIPRGTRDVYFSDDVSALSFTDRTPYPIDLKTAYDAVLSMKRLPNGVYEEDNKENQLDHSALHPFIRSSDGEHRDLSATVSAQNEVIKDLIKRIEELEQQVKELEGK